MLGVSGAFRSLLSSPHVVPICASGDERRASVLSLVVSSSTLSSRPLILCHYNRPSRTLLHPDFLSFSSSDHRLLFFQTLLFSLSLPVLFGHRLFLQSSPPLMKHPSLPLRRSPVDPAIVATRMVAAARVLAAVSSVVRRSPVLPQREPQLWPVTV